MDGLVYSGDGLHAFYVTAKENAGTVLEKKLNQASESISEAVAQIKNVIGFMADSPTGSFSSGGASVVVSGGTSRT